MPRLQERDGETGGGEPGQVAAQLPAQRVPAPRVVDVAWVVPRPATQAHRLAAAVRHPGPARVGPVRETLRTATLKL